MELVDFDQDRVAREKSAYEQGLQRKRYNEALQHTHYFYRQKRRSLIGQLLRNAKHAAMLEVGCDAWFYFAEPSGVQPETLICTNISQREIDQMSAAATETRLKPDFRLMDVHHLAFSDNSFDIVFGMSILHHLNLQQALSEIHRVLKPEGLFLFVEPLDINPFGRIVRSLTPKARTVDEKPFRRHDLTMIKQYFRCDFHYEQLVSVPLGFLSKQIYASPDNPITRAAFWLDELMARNVPAVGDFYRFVVIAGALRPVPKALPDTSRCHLV